MNGIDVSCADGVIDWAGAYAEGVEFALVRASAARLSDARFSENIHAAHAAGIAVGVYHDLHAHSTADARAEAAVFLETISPVCGKIRLWAACHAEVDFLRDLTRQARGEILGAFLDAVMTAGFSPMLGADAETLASLPSGGKHDLWLLGWGITEARALSFSPRIWQYGAGRTASIASVRMDRGYFSDMGK